MVGGRWRWWVDGGGRWSFDEKEQQRSEGSVLGNMVADADQLPGDYERRTRTPTHPESEQENARHWPVVPPLPGGYVGEIDR